MFEKFLIYLLIFLIGFICASLLWKIICDNYTQIIKKYDAVIKKYEQENQKLYYKDLERELNEFVKTPQK